MQLLNNVTVLFGIIGLSSIHQEFAKIVKDICLATAKEQSTSSFIYITNEKSPDGHINIAAIFQNLQRQNPISVVNIDAQTPIERYRFNFNHNLISIVQLSEDTSSNAKILQTLWQRLHGNVQSKLVLLVDSKANDEYVAHILEFCARNHAINVIALQPQMAVKENSYWTLRIFPVQRTIKLTFPAFYRAMFHKHLENMHGHKLRLFGSIYLPQFYMYSPRHGPSTISGFMGRALAEYANRHNGSIEYSLTDEYKLLMGNIHEIIEENATVIGPLWPIQFPLDGIILTNTIHFLDLCLMIPLEESLPKLAFFYAIVKKTVVISFSFSFVLISFFCALTTRLKTGQQVPLIEYFVKFSVLQGLLGMPFYTKWCTSRVHKTICITISLAGVIIGTAYSTYLQSFSMNAPIASPIKTVGDVFKRGLKIPIDTNWWIFLKAIPHFQNYIYNFAILKNSSQITVLRDKFDTRYAYIVDDMWEIYKEAQNYYSRPLFRLSDICLWKDMQLALPLPDNSEYRDNLDIFFLLLHEVGLLNHWMRHAMIELLEMDLISFEDRNKQFAFKPLKLEDLRMVLIAMGVLEMLNIICFFDRGILGTNMQFVKEILFEFKEL